MNETLAHAHIAIIGATGAVGSEMIKILGERHPRIASLRLFASEKSANRTIDTAYGPITVQPFSLDALDGVDVALLAVSGDFAKATVPQISARGIVAIDNSSAFRYDPDVPLLIPEINGDAFKGQSIIANPNCTTAILCMALAPLHRAFGLKRVIVSSYQAASGAGNGGMAELIAQSESWHKGADMTAKVFQHPLAFNVIPHIDRFEDNGYTREEMKVVWETRKIMRLPDLAVSCTAVRVPALRAHSEAVTLETERPVDVATARSVLRDAPGVRLVDDPASNAYPMPLTASGQDPVEVGRIRRNPVFGDNGLDLFVCGDQIRKGAALNAVQIAELLDVDAVRSAREAALTV